MRRAESRRRRPNEWITLIAFFAAGKLVEQLGKPVVVTRLDNHATLAERLRAESDGKIIYSHLKGMDMDMERSKGCQTHIPRHGRTYSKGGAESFYKLLNATTGIINNVMRASRPGSRHCLL